MGLAPGPSYASQRIAFILIAALAVASCGDSARAILREDEAVRPYMQFSVVVDRESGSLGPAQTRADTICSEVLQSALMYIATDVGDDQTRYYFRCK